jgi:DNA invertase Pin-like site-specific DNA recombinase
MNAIGYIRVSTEEQSRNGGGLEAQRQAITAECRRRGWQLLETVEDRGYSAKDLKRPGIQAVLEAMEAGEATALVTAKLDRLSRSMLDFSTLMVRAQEQRWAFVALDCAVDTTTPAGEAMANVLATFAQFERRLISQRTKDAIRAKKRRNGKRAGRKSKLPPGLAERIDRDRSEGKSLATIAAGLNAESVPTGQGGRQWWPSTVRAVLRRS